MGEWGLEEQFLQLVQILEQMQRQVIELEKSNAVLVNSNNQLIDWVRMVEKDVLCNMKF